MKNTTMAVKLSPKLEADGRGLCDPESHINGQVITPANYGPKGYMRVHPTGFIQAQIDMGILLEVQPKPNQKPVSPRSKNGKGALKGRGRKS